MLKSIQQEWEDFSKKVIPECTQKDVQYLEMRKAFFAGALSLLNGVNAMGNPKIPEKDCLKYLNERADELQEFYVNLMKEYAEKN